MKLSRFVGRELSSGDLGTLQPRGGRVYWIFVQLGEGRVGWNADRGLSMIDPLYLPVLDRVWEVESNS